jgi:hypothetical protein
VAGEFFLEKELASLRHLFPAKNPPATPRRDTLEISRFSESCFLFFEEVHSLVQRTVVGVPFLAGKNV